MPLIETEDDLPYTDSDVMFLQDPDPNHAANHFAAAPKEAEDWSFFNSGRC